MKSMSNNGSIYYSSDVSSVKSFLQPFWKHISIFNIFICQVKAIMYTFLFQPERLFQCYFIYICSQFVSHDIRNSGNRNEEGSTAALIGKQCHRFSITESKLCPGKWIHLINMIHCIIYNVSNVSILGRWIYLPFILETEDRWQRNAPTTEAMHIFIHSILSIWDLRAKKKYSFIKVHQCLLLRWR